jgi:Holliday junction resolvase RusA-like endonuclease
VNGSVSFVVKGNPAPAGSKSAFPFRRRDGRLGVRVTDASGARGKAWREAVALAASRAMGGQKPMTGPLKLTAMFYLSRPKSHFNSRGLLKDKSASMLHHTQKPDLTKLLRAVEDAMTGIVYEDDAQIVGQTVGKFWTDGDPLANVFVWQESDA